MMSLKRMEIFVLLHSDSYFIVRVVFFSFHFSKQWAMQTEHISAIGIVLFTFSTACYRCCCCCSWWSECALPNLDKKRHIFSNNTNWEHKMAFNVTLYRYNAVKLIKNGLVDYFKWILLPFLYWSKFTNNIIQLIQMECMLNCGKM